MKGKMMRKGSRGGTWARVVPLHLPRPNCQGFATLVGLLCLFLALTACRHKPRPVVLTLAEGVALELVRVPAGEFTMGSEKGYAQESPEHEVYLDEYLIGKHELTVAQFRAFVEASAYETTAEQEGRGFAWIEDNWYEVDGADWQHPLGPGSDARRKGDHPVVQVSWWDATAFAQWASGVIEGEVRL